jgi:hypothetical protein
MISKDAVRDLEKNLKTKAPAMLVKLAMSEPFVTEEVAKEALAQGAFPKRSVGRPNEQDLGRYKGECLEFLRQIERTLAGHSGVVETEVAVEPPTGILPEIAPQTPVEAPQEAVRPESGLEPPKEEIIAPRALGRPLMGAGRSPRSTTPPEGMTRVMINIPLGLHKRLKLRAVELDKTMTEIILEALTDALGKPPLG